MLTLKTATILLIVSISCLFIESCTIERNLAQADPFVQLYSPPAEYNIDSDSSLPDDAGERITLSASQMPLSIFARIISDRFGIGLVYAEELADKKITAEIKQTDLKSVLNVISRQIQVDVIRSGNTYYIGNLRSEDRGVLVRKVFGTTQKELQDIIISMISTQGRTNVTVDCVAVITDHETVLRRCAEMLDYLELTESPVWILQLYFVSLRKDAMVSAGIATKSSGALSYDVAENKLNLDEAKIEALFTFDTSSQFADVYASPMLLCRDGTQASWSDGESVPIVKKSVSDYGTVQTSGYDYKSIGFNISSTVKATKNKKANLVLKVSMSEIKGYVETAPSTVLTSFNVDVDLVPKKIYILGELSTFKDVDNQNAVFNFGTTSGRTMLQVWGKVYRISSDVHKRPPLYKPMSLYDRWRIGPFR